MITITVDFLLVYIYALTSCLAGLAISIGEVDPSKSKIKLIAVPQTKSRTTEYEGDQLFQDPILSRTLLFKFYITKRWALFSGIGQGIFILYRYFHGLPLSSTAGKAFAFNILAIFSFLMRIWCYKTLQESFTYSLKVFEDQKLITTGPYTFLSHPSYTAMIFSQLSLFGALMGPFNALLDGLNDQPFSYSTFLTKLRINNPHSVFLTLNMASAFFANLVVICLIFFVRIPNEEKMLHSHFGQRYSEFLSKRWRLFPFLY